MRLILLFGLSVLILSASHASEAESQHATLFDKVIRVEPWGATFVIPSAWNEWYATEHNNLHLRGAQLQKVKDANGTWDADFAGVVNAVLPFERCILHAGGEGWGSEGHSFADLQMRMYLVGQSSNDLPKLIAEKGLSTARNISKHETRNRDGNDITFTEDVVREWHHIAIGFPVRHRDGLDEVRGIDNVAFYLRSFGSDMVVLVFMYSDYPYSEIKNDIQAILASFKDR